jgi:hypothetical protein
MKSGAGVDLSNDLSRLSQDWVFLTQTDIILEAPRSLFNRWSMRCTAYSGARASSGREVLAPAPLSVRAGAFVTRDVAVFFSALHSTHIHPSVSIGLSWSRVRCLRYHARARPHAGLTADPCHTSTV